MQADQRIRMGSGAVVKWLALGWLALTAVLTAYATYRCSIGQGREMLVETDYEGENPFTGSVVRLIGGWVVLALLATDWATVVEVSAAGITMKRWRRVRWSVRWAELAGWYEIRSTDGKWLHALRLVTARGKGIRITAPLTPRRSSPLADIAQALRQRCPHAAEREAARVKMTLLNDRGQQLALLVFLAFLAALGFLIWQTVQMLPKNLR